MAANAALGEIRVSRALVVEDDLVAQLLLAELVGEYAEVDVAGSAEQARGAIEAALQGGKPYDLVCLDIGLLGSKQSGIDILRELRTAEAALGRWPAKNAAKVIMTTGSNAAGDIIGAFRQNCDGYLKKPVSAQNLEKELLRVGFADVRPRP
jgi:two-component system, chemotaxis family, chemotaxis protein CheY